MATFLELAEAQYRIGEALKEALLQFPKPPHTRSKQPIVLKLLGSVDKYWLQFLRNDAAIKALASVDMSESYFVDEYFQTIKQLTGQIMNKINDSLLAINANHPTYDLINRGEFEHKRMFDDEGNDLTNTATNGTNVAGASSLRGGNENLTEDKRTRKNNLDEFLAPTVQDFFENISNRSSNTVEGEASLTGDTNMRRAMDSLTQALEKLRAAIRDKAEHATQLRMAQRIASRWHELQRLNEKLLTLEPNKYNATIFYDFEDAHQSMLNMMFSTYELDKSVTTTADSSKKVKSIKMPQIEIPKFSGDYSKWEIFKDLFAQLIDQRDLTEAEKFMYLRSSVTGEALEIIQTLRITSENYELAWKLLDERYENPRQIVKAILAKLFNMEKAKPHHFASLKKTYDSFRENMYAVKMAAKTNENLIEMILHQLLLNKIDNVSMGLYEQGLENEKQPTSVEVLLRFIAKRFRALEHANEEAHKPQNHNNQQRYAAPKQRATAMNVVVTDKKQKTCDCKDQHILAKCPKFEKMTISNRFKAAKKAEICFKCLKPGHSNKDCTGKPCFTCNKNHHTMLHFTQKATAHLGSTVKNIGFDHVFLGTAVINVMSVHGVPIKMRALLDSGSQLSIMSEKMLKKTGLGYTPVNMEVTGIGEVTAASNKRTTITISSLHSAFTSSLEVFIMKTVTTCQPIKEVDTSSWKMPKQVQLADDKFNIPDKVDLLIGCELFYKLLAHGLISIGKGLPELQNTVFGWVVIGRLLGLETNKAFTGIGTMSNKSLKEQVERFWKIEEKFTESEPLTDAERKCEIEFERSTVRKSDGRFKVNLQFIGDPMRLGESKDMAIRRFLSLERRFSKDPQLKMEYCKFMNEYIELGHMFEAPKDIMQQQHYVIPHHSVLNPESSTTKFRVVFDASAKTTNGIALNEIMANGPKLQQDLFSIMTRFRMWRYVFSADIGKMYRQIEIAEHQYRWQIIVWRSDSSEEIKFFILKTVTYGTKCASYLAIKALQTLADIEAENYPLAAEVTKRDFNVDDVMTGADDLTVAIQCQQQLREMLPLGKFDLHKWCANHPALLDEIPEKKRAVSLDIEAENNETKALGMKWIPSTDIFSLKYIQKEQKRITKRTILSETAQLFDPLGLVNPVILKAKVFLQQLWVNKLDWDDALPQVQQEQWTQYRDQLPSLTSLQIPRRVIIEDATSLQLHVFSDASELAYGAVIYVRSVDESGTIQTNLLCSKSRVAPIAEMKATLPRLELMGAVVATELMKKVKGIIEHQVEGVNYWTDSEIVLSWLYNDASLKTFVGNRVNKIKRNTDVSSWRHVDSKNNPADLISRGLSVDEIENNRLWWQGPDFLSKPENEWPKSKIEFKQEPTEEKIQRSILAASKCEVNVIASIKHGNSINRWQRILAYCVKFIDKPTEPESLAGGLSTKHLNKALSLIIKYAQRDGLKEDIKSVQMAKPEKTQFKTMTPIMDADGILRVGGRLQEADLPFEQRHPAILPYQHEVTRMIMQQLHIENKHAGPQALLALVREKYWPIKGKTMAKSIVEQCVLCSRAKPKLFEQIMGNLPRDRITTSRCFLNTGVDFAGPIVIHYNGRGNRTTKAYICVFVCFSTKAVHLEPAVDLSMAAFLRCLKRFIARRGIPQRIYSDNATNFKATHKYLDGLANIFETEDFNKRIVNYCWDHKIEWRFIPPRSPHFGGLWESAVKSAKQLLVKILHNQRLTYDELTTVLSEIEAILNSRPLSTMSDDPNDVQPLTAGHFLTGAPLRSISDSAVVGIPKTQQWSQLVAIRNEFWKRWVKEYLHELQAKKKWRQMHPNTMVGQLVVLKDDRLPPLQWQLGRVIETIPDKDAIVRVLNVKTATGTFMRAIHELAPIPTEQDEMQVVTEKPNVVNLSTKDKPKKVQLNAEAPEFQWNTKTHHKDAERVDKKALVKATKKVINKKANHSPEIAGTPSKTRSGRIFGVSNVIAVMIGILLLIIGSGAQPCNTTTFRNNPGLFFEKMGQLSLSNNAWTIVCHLKMQEYWDQTTHMRTMMQHIKTACPHVHPDEHCTNIQQQLELQFSAIIEKNELIKSFSHQKGKRSIRSTEEKGDFSGKRKNGGWFNTIQHASAKIFGSIEDELNTMMHPNNSWSNQIKAVTTQLFGKMSHNEAEHWNDILQSQSNKLNRQKRGWFDGVGKGAREVFGILNVDDAKHYDSEIKKLHANSNYLKQLIYNQTVIQDMTMNVIRTTSDETRQQLRYLNKTIAAMTDKNDVGKFHTFNALSLQTMTMMNNYRETQNAVVDMLTEVFHGKIPPSVITPTQLKYQLQLVADHIGHDLMIPGDDQRGRISQLYTMLTAKVSVTDENLIVKITIPLISREFYHLYHVIPVPFMHEGKLHTIVPSTPYLAVNLKQDHFYMLNDEEKQTCKVFSDGFLICNQQKPLFSIQTPNKQCEMAVLLNPQDVHQTCKIQKTDQQQIWFSLATQNNYLYTMKETMEVSIICEANTKHCTLTGSGVMEIPSKCIVKSGSTEVTARNVLTSEPEPIMLVPTINISSNIPKRKEVIENFENWSELVNNAEMDTIQKAINQQKIDSSIQFANDHDIHHYTISYTMLCIMITIGSYFVYKHRLQCCLRRRTVNITQKSNDLEMGQMTVKAESMENRPLPPAPRTRSFNRKLFLGGGDG